MIFDDLSGNYIWLQAFWPSIVMKKWLNIKPKVYDFSEDETLKLRVKMMVWF